MTAHQATEDLSSREIWILEDDPGTIFVYSEGLGIDRHLRLFGKIADVVAALAANDCTYPDLLIADLRLPDGSFLNYLEHHGAKICEQSLLLVVSSVEETEILRKCFACGASDYLTKPFSVSELRVKMDRLLGQQAMRKARKQGAIALDPRTFEICVDGKTSPILTQKEFQIMALLVASPTSTIEKSALNLVLSGVKKVGPKALDVHLVNLRRKLAKVDYEIHSVQNQAIILVRS